MVTTKGPKGQIYNWPTYRFGPGGEKKLFETPDDVPAGWGRSPVQASEAPEADLDDMNREELEAHAVGLGIDLDAIEGSGKNGNVLVADIRKAIEEA